MSRARRYRPKDTSTSVRSVSDASIKRRAANDIRLPAVSGPSIGIKVTTEDFPFAGFVTRPCCSDVTKGVFNNNPGSV